MHRRQSCTVSSASPPMTTGYFILLKGMALVRVRDDVQLPGNPHQKRVSSGATVRHVYQGSCCSEWQVSAFPRPLRPCWMQTSSLWRRGRLSLLRGHPARLRMPNPVGEVTPVTDGGEHGPRRPWFVTCVPPDSDAYVCGRPCLPDRIHRPGPLFP